MSKLMWHTPLGNYGLGALCFGKPAVQQLLEGLLPLLETPYWVPFPSDKGAAAALMMAKTHALFRGIAARPGASHIFSGAGEGSVPCQRNIGCE